MKLCKDCKHSTLGEKRFLDARREMVCAHPADTSPVTGALVRMSCYWRRERDVDKCGPEGRLFEPRESAEEKPAAQKSPAWRIAAVFGVIVCTHLAYIIPGLAIIKADQGWFAEPLAAALCVLGAMAQPTVAGWLLARLIGDKT